MLSHQKTITILLRKAETLSSENDQEAAEGVYKQALHYTILHQQNPSHIYMKRGQFYKSQGKLDLSEKDFYQGLLLRGKKNYQEGKFVSASQDFGRALEKEESAELFFYQAVCTARLKRPLAARTIFLKAMALDKEGKGLSDQPGELLLLVWELCEKGLPEKERVINPLSSDLYYYRAISQIENTQQCIDDFTTGIWLLLHAQSPKLSAKIPQYYALRRESYLNLKPIQVLAAVQDQVSLIKHILTLSIQNLNELQWVDLKEINAQEPTSAVRKKLTDTIIADQCKEFAISLADKATNIADLETSYLCYQLANDLLQLSEKNDSDNLLEHLQQSFLDKQKSKEAQDKMLKIKIEDLKVNIKLSFQAKKEEKSQQTQIPAATKAAPKKDPRNKPKMLTPPKPKLSIEQQQERQLRHALLVKERHAQKAKEAEEHAKKLLEKMTAEEQAKKDKIESIKTSDQNRVEQRKIKHQNRRKKLLEARRNKKVTETESTNNSPPSEEESSTADDFSDASLSTTPSFRSDASSAEEVHENLDLGQKITDTTPRVEKNPEEEEEKKPLLSFGVFSPKKTAGEDKALDAISSYLIEGVKLSVTDFEKSIIDRINKFGGKNVLTLIVGGIPRDRFRFGPFATSNDLDIVTNASVYGIKTAFSGQGVRIKEVDDYFGKLFLIYFRNGTSLQVVRSKHWVEAADLQTGLLTCAKSRDFFPNAAYLAGNGNFYAPLPETLQCLQSNNIIMKSIDTAAISFKNFPIRMLRAIKYQVQLKALLPKEEEVALSQFSYLISKESRCKIISLLNNLFRKPYLLDSYFLLHQYQFLDKLFPGMQYNYRGSQWLLDNLQLSNKSEHCNLAYFCMLILVNTLTSRLSKFLSWAKDPLSHLHLLDFDSVEYLILESKAFLKLPQAALLNDIFAEYGKYHSEEQFDMLFKSVLYSWDCWPNPPQVYAKPFVSEQTPLLISTPTSSDVNPSATMSEEKHHSHSRRL